MFDLLAVAYQTNMTRIATFMMAAEVSNIAYPQVGVSDAFHPLSHHAENKQSMEKLAIVQRYHSDVFRELPHEACSHAGRRRGLDARQLDIPVRQQHEQQQQARLVPVADVVFGHGGGIKGHQHLRYADRTPIANLLFTMMLRAGVPVESVGDSTGELAEV